MLGGTSLIYPPVHYLVNSHPLLCNSRIILRGFLRYFVDIISQSYWKNQQNHIIYHIIYHIVFYICVIIYWVILLFIGLYIIYYIFYNFQLEGLETWKNRRIDTKSQSSHHDTSCQSSHHDTSIFNSTLSKHQKIHR